MLIFKMVTDSFSLLESEFSAKYENFLLSNKGT